MYINKLTDIVPWSLSEIFFFSLNIGQVHAKHLQDLGNATYKNGIVQ